MVYGVKPSFRVLILHPLRLWYVSLDLFPNNSNHNQLGCLSSVLRQLRVFHTDLNRFVTTLRERLGPQLQNVSLLYQGTPELKEVLADYGIHLNTPEVPLNARELRARFQSLVENVFSVIAETRLFALFLDDLHEADPSLSGLGLDSYLRYTYFMSSKNFGSCINATKFKKQDGMSNLILILLVN